MMLLVILHVIIFFFLLFSFPLNSSLLWLCLRRGARRMCLVAIPLHHLASSKHVEQLLSSDVKSIF